MAEDCADNQRWLDTVLRQAGAVVSLAENGQQAVDQALASWAAGEPFDLLLMDMQMPVMDGCTATRRLREAGYRAPILALTADNSLQEQDACRRAGCEQFAAKPLSREELLDLVNQYGSRQQPASHQQEKKSQLVAREIMSATVVSVSPDTPLDITMEMLVANQISGLPVVDAAGRLAGVISEADRLKEIDLSQQVKKACVGDYMSLGVVTVDENMSIEQVTDLLMRMGIRRAPVTRNGHIVGIISRRDLIRALNHTPILA